MQGCKKSKVITVVNRIQRMIQVNTRSEHYTNSHNVYIWSDLRPLPEKGTFYKIEITFFFLPCIALD